MLVFTFFELLGDIIRNRTPLVTVGEYLINLTPSMIYNDHAFRRAGCGAGDLWRADSNQRVDRHEGNGHQPVPSCSAHVS